jgi:predicted RNA binding protein YcfA (HicA-like mRNA interferase family)
VRIVSGKEFLRILQKRGWVVIRSRGSHFMLEKEGYPLLIVPVHGSKTLKAGVLKGLLKDAGMTEADLLDA